MRLSELSLAWRTDFIVHRVGGLVEEREDCIVVRTPGQPSFYWGNALLMPEVPGDAAVAHWIARFETEVLRNDPQVRHVALGINRVAAGESAEGALPSWRAAGFDLIETVALGLGRGGLLRPAKAPRGSLRFRCADLDRDGHAFVALQCASNDGFEPQGYRHHRRLQMDRIAAMRREGVAEWFGLWCDGVLAADCGLLRDGALGRFQHVGTHPDWRRRGLCTALVHGVAEWAFSAWGLSELVMCADPGDVAIGIYESLGFERRDRVWALQRRAPQDRG